jgi:hypothetical protein
MRTSELSHVRPRISAAGVAGSSWEATIALGRAGLAVASDLLDLRKRSFNREHPRVTLDKAGPQRT